ncbi:hypothetical protein WJX72_006081 [[Myrmecia] bisecta]|uniref:TIR domain-containing protein n=1 Tax=[Myrmecia] bisecta TaxID=41462 RepID=A0AAW1P742_9CHLO
MLHTAVNYCSLIEPIETASQAKPTSVGRVTLSGSSSQTSAMATPEVNPYEGRHPESFCKESGGSGQVQAGSGGVWTRLFESDDCKRELRMVVDLGVDQCRFLYLPVFMWSTPGWVREAALNAFGSRFADKVTSGVGIRHYGEVIQEMTKTEDMTISQVCKAIADCLRPAPKDVAPAAPNVPATARTQEQAKAAIQMELEYSKLQPSLDVIVAYKNKYRRGVDEQLDKNNQLKGDCFNSPKRTGRYLKIDEHGDDGEDGPATRAWIRKLAKIGTACKYCKRARGLAGPHVPATARTPEQDRTPSPQTPMEDAEVAASSMALPNSSRGYQTASCRRVVIYHAPEDRESIAEPLCAALSDCAITAVADQDESALGQSISQTMPQNVRSAHGAIALLSEQILCGDSLAKVLELGGLHHKDHYQSGTLDKQTLETLIHKIVQAAKTW